MSCRVRLLSFRVPLSGPPAGDYRISVAIHEDLVVGILGLEFLDLRHDLGQGEFTCPDVDEYLIGFHSVAPSEWIGESHGAVSRARTSDFKIFSLALSQLSYHGVIPPYRYFVDKGYGLEVASQ